MKHRNPYSFPKVSSRSSTNVVSLLIPSRKRGIQPLGSKANPESGPGESPEAQHFVWAGMWGSASGREGVGMCNGSE